MNTNLNATHPLALVSALVQFLQDIHRPRGVGATVSIAKDDVSLMQLYRLSRGRESIAPGVNAMLANRFER
ncbi:hypothetical protein ABT364_04800 [Massilia sp. SR12]